MRWSPEKLRWMLLGGAVLLGAVLAAVFGLANYRAGKVWQRILARNGVNLRRESDGVTWSQSDGKRTIFTLHASKAVPGSDGSWDVRSGVLILYGKDGRSDRIYGSQFQYDPKNQVVRAIGEVHLDLEAPDARAGAAREGGKPSLSFTPESESDANPGLIHVRTSGLVYVRKLGVAATDQPTEFRYRGLTCTSRGAEFNSGQNVLRLLADVHVAGMLRAEPFGLLARRAVLDRAANTAEFEEPRVDSGERHGQAQHALMHLRHNGSVETGEADGAVQLVEGTRTLRAPRLHAEFGAEDRPQHAVFSGGVAFADADRGRPVQGAAGTLDLRMTASGTVSEAFGDGGVSLTAREMQAAGPDSTRRMRAQRATADFVPVGDGKRSRVSLLHLLGGAEVVAETPGRGSRTGVTDAAGPGFAPGRATGAGGTATTRLDADDLVTTFAASSEKPSPMPERTLGTGHTLLDQVAGDGQHQVSTGDRLEMHFAERIGAGANGGLEVVSAVQTGAVRVQTWPAPKAGATGTGEPSTGRAERADYEAAEGALTLSGTGAEVAEVGDGGTQMRAPAIVLHQGTGDGEASGGVSATMAATGTGEATHVLAARAVLLHGPGLSQFFGTDAEPARLWQGGSQVQAAKIVLDSRQHAMSARPDGAGGSVRTVFVSAHETPGPGLDSKDSRPVTTSEDRTAKVRTGGSLGLGGRMPEASRDTVQVRSAAVDYSDVSHEATFRGEVEARGAEGEIWGDRGVAFLQAPAKGGGVTTAERSVAHAPDLGGRLDRLVVEGAVRLREPGRTGTGEQITYTSATNSYVLTGTPAEPPRVHDAAQGTVTGTTLLFGAADSSIVVAGTPGAKPVRVHTETDLK